MKADKKQLELIRKLADARGASGFEDEVLKVVRENCGWAERIEEAEAQEAKRLAFIRREIDWIRRAPQARGCAP